MLFINRLFIAVLLFFSGQFQKSPEIPEEPVFINSEAEVWADSVLYRMSLRQKIGQLFMVAAYPQQGQEHIRSVERLIRDYQIGGLIFFKGNPSRQVQLHNHYQNIAQIPLLIAIDGEWGISMRLDSTIKFPRQMTLGAIQKERLIYEFGREVGRECRRMGIHVNFAPVIDVNNNPANPVINTRAFGDERDDVARKGIMYMKGMQDEGVLACGKHFPGHGNTNVDSHYDLPQLTQTIEELDSIELYPFKKLIDKGLGSVMVAHLNIPSMDNARKRPSTLSKKIIKGWLKDSLGFKGLVFTDALNMKGVAKYFKPGEVDLEAFKAGNDVLLFPENVPEAVRRIEEAIMDSVVPISELDEKVKKILMTKQWTCLPHNRMVKPANLINDLNPEYAQLLNSQLYRSAITLLRNKDSILPIDVNANLKIASVAVNGKVNNFFQRQLREYDAVDFYALPGQASAEEIARLVSKLKLYDRVIISFHNVSTRASRDFNMTQNMRDFVTELLLKQIKVVNVVFGNPYSLDKIKSLRHCHGLYISYEEKKLAQYHTAKMIFGADVPSGKLPVSVGKYNRGEGLTYARIKTDLNFIPSKFDELQLDKFPKVDSIVIAAIDSMAIPGCQLLIAFEGDILYHKTFGYHTYNEKRLVQKDHLYDIASITKIAATALCLMKLYEAGRINIDERVSHYLPELKKSNKKDMVLREMWAHQAGLVSWIPFWRETVDEHGNPDKQYYASSDSGGKYHKVVQDLYIKKSYEEQIWEQIIASDMNKKKDYKYSDLGLIISRRLIERVSGEKLEDYVKANFYEPLELGSLLFRPRDKFTDEMIVPTENDTNFRKILVHGYVHDPGAAMTNGVDGHAGLFATSSDLAVIMQMLVQGGIYNGTRYFKQSTIELFTSTQYIENENRRALVFDKAQPDTAEIGPTTYDATLSSFGHSGFTGAYTWADPDNQLVFVFLANRIHPDANNTKLIKGNIRTEIQQAIYDALGRGRYKAEQKHY